ncbi:MAG: SHOCT domain-containing protein [Deltaproteobacteria bacterium]|nr:SHOCT domain-containing protein [Deltaproteobacteria bacterium]
MTENKKNPLLSGVMAGYMILLVHLLLIVVLATSVVFIQTLAKYIEYVLAGGFLLIFGSAIFFYHLLKKNGRQIINTLKNPAFHGQRIEISLLGGLASVSINNPDKDSQLMLENQPRTLKALPEIQTGSCPGESPQSELLRLADLYDRKLISEEEFQQLKREILKASEN